MVLVALTLLLAGATAPDDPPPAQPPDPEPWTFEAEEPPRLDLTLWAGQAWLERASGLRGEAWGAEATWRFDALDVGLFGGAYELRDGAGAPYRAPVWLARIGQRFETRNGLLASFTLGLGAARASDWRSWFQVALGVRVPLGPAFVGGELGFESDDVLRLSLGLGVSLF